MDAILQATVQQKLENFINKDVYVHLETTNGAYASHFNRAHNVGVMIRNANVRFSQAKIVEENNTFRVGLKMDIGWIYAEGLTDWEIFEGTKLLLAGHDQDGRLMVALQISETPFNY
ncbi:YojF family protein [Virgibacillus soli]|uniref:YojF family protein n=1 Tax=Paracerasibacillus soli TaxID=480284 RepID=A0ABU5CRA4_9BACI|nr:YojF family protein [Virgibacillus soli]MDY0408902.1 YojF family protein [Virgibacillus soli]